MITTFGDVCYILLGRACRIKILKDLQHKSRVIIQRETRGSLSIKIIMIFF